MSHDSASKLIKVKQQLLTYASYPLCPITVDQAKMSFLNELVPEQSSYEFKLLKCMLKYNNARLLKAVKTYSYEKMAKFEVNKEKQILVFYAGDQ